MWYILFRDRPNESKYVSPTELVHIQKDRIVVDKAQGGFPLKPIINWKLVFLNPSLLSNCYAFFTFGYVIFFAITWLPGYLEQIYSIKLKQVGLFLIAPWLTAMIFLLAGGFISDWLWRKTKSTRLARSHLIWITQILSAICFLPVIFVHSLPVAIISISLGLGFASMANAVFYAVNADLAADQIATSLGVMISFFALAGILSPLLTGILSTITGNFNAAFILLICLVASSALGIIIFQHPQKIKRI